MLILARINIQRYQLLQSAVAIVGDYHFPAIWTCCRFGELLETCLTHAMIPTVRQYPTEHAIEAYPTLDYPINRTKASTTSVLSANQRICHREWYRPLHDLGEFGHKWLHQTN